MKLFKIEFYMILSKWQGVSTRKCLVRAIQLVVLSSCFTVCSKCHSDMNPLNVNHVTDYNLGFKSVEKSVNNLLIINAG